MSEPVAQVTEEEVAEQVVVEAVTEEQLPEFALLIDMEY